MTFEIRNTLQFSSLRVYNFFLSISKPFHIRHHDGNLHKYQNRHEYKEQVPIYGYLVSVSENYQLIEIDPSHKIFKIGGCDLWSEIVAPKGIKEYITLILVVAILMDSIVQKIEDRK